jgi:hypothetical protein
VVRVTLVLLAFASAALAAPSDCAPGTLDDYLALGSDGCRLGSRVVSDIALSAPLSGATAIDPATVSVTPSVFGRSGSLSFGFAQSASGGQIFQSTIEGTITPETGTPEIIDLLLINASAGNDGVVTGLIDLCSEPFAFGTCFGTPLPPAAALVSASGSFPLARTQTPALPSFGFLQDIVIDAGVSGTASLEASRLTFTSVPEPGTAVGLATGLGMLLAVRRALSKH